MSEDASGNGVAVSPGLNVNAVIGAGVMEAVEELLVEVVAGTNSPSGAGHDNWLISRQSSCAPYIREPPCVVMPTA